MSYSRSHADGVFPVAQTSMATQYGGTGQHLFRRLRGAAMRLRPAGRILHEFFHFRRLALVEPAALLRHLQHVPPGGERMQRDAEIARGFFCPRERCRRRRTRRQWSTVAPASRSALQKLTLLRPSVVMSSTSSTRSPASRWPSICALRPKPFGFLRTYCIGSISRSAIQAANGMPAVSPPATASNCSKPTSRSTRRRAEIDQRPAHPRKRDQPAAIGIDRARPAGGEDERLVGHEADRLDLDAAFLPSARRSPSLSGKPSVILVIRFCTYAPWRAAY